MENLRGAALMTLAMLGFAIEDTFIKLVSVRLPTWQIITLLGLGGASLYAAMVRLKGQPLFSRDMLSWTILLRNLGELFGALCFVSAITLIPLSTASAILQATPLAVTLGAALFLKEPVGWRRWSAIIVGFIGVLVIIRPGLEGFDSRALLALASVLLLALRDLATRLVPKTVSSFQLSFMGFASLVPAGGILALISGEHYVAPNTLEWSYVALAMLAGVAGYYAVVGAMRMGEVAFVTPFRYFRMLFALVAGYLIFAERPDALTLTGAAIVVASGLYTLWRERATLRTR